MRVIFLGCGYLGYNLYTLLKKDFDTEMWGIDSPYVSKVKDFNEVNAFSPTDMEKQDFQDAVVVDTVALVANNARSSDEEEALRGVMEVYRTLINVLKKGGCRQFVYFSSGGTIYGNSLEPISEAFPINPQTLYARSKARVEEVIQESDLNYLILRLSNPYGGYQISGKKQGVIPILIRKALTGNPFEMWIDGESIRDYFYITDLAQALTLLLKKEVNNEIVNVGSGEPTKLNEVIETVEKVTGKKIEIVHKSADVPVVQAIVLDISKLRKLTGYKPEVSLEEGIREEARRIEKEQEE